ncbi:hypothetical protein CDD83_8560 [Cordyceps sp. RAO-2017]|nr:hypothetical protein CDD83_8560 [Cordyceps sp. RAO-2017]
MSSNVLLVPIQLQAFVLNPAVCNSGTDDDKGSRIIPISQPNYTFLRLDNFLIQSDVLGHADLHNAAPADLNSRLTDLGAPGRPVTRLNRCGVYLHWILPQLYRTGLSAADSVPASSHEQQRQPEFHQPPTRWIVIRHLDLDSVQPVVARPAFSEYQAWVVESDHLWTLEDIPSSYDLQVDVSPFVIGVSGGTADIDQQAEVFIGRKTPLETWSDEPGAAAADISLLRSSNQLFADFQMHNTNVFSILDNFEYRGEASDPSSSPQYLTQATASYYVVGWHADKAKDPLWGESSYSRGTKLDALCVAIKDAADSDAIKAWLEATDPACLCLHGALYDVQWNLSAKPATVPADEYAKSLQRQDVPAVSVGTTPMDALITYCTSRHAHGEDASIARLEEDILAIDSLLHARDDGVEAQREAKDTVYNWNFSRSQGGSHFYLAGQDPQGKPTQPGQDAIVGLAELNQYQLLLDSCLRAARQYRWDLFSTWWKYVSDVDNKSDGDSALPYKTRAGDLAVRLQGLEARIQQLSSAVQAMLSDNDGSKALSSAKTGTLPFYYRSRDPTVLIGGIPSGWPSDFSDKVQARLPAQVVEPTVPISSALDGLVHAIARALSQTTQLQAVPQLCAEFLALAPDSSPPQSPPSGQSFPQFHETTAAPDGTVLWRDQWGGRQPWFPLYAEWEVEYTHVPMELWSLDEQAARLSDGKLVRYGIPAAQGSPLWEQIKDPDADSRILSGRALVLPQPSFSLAAKVKQLFQDTPPATLDQYLAKADRDDLVANIGKLSYLSFPLAGLTEGLLTLSHGAHIKPESRDRTTDGQSILSAVKAAEFPLAGFDTTTIERIMGNSALTPYAAMTNFGGPTTTSCPFKPVTHGQFRFRKLNIIDKFGQALVAIDPKPRPQGLPPLYPCISDFYEPQALQLPDGSRAANTVRQNSEQNCEYMQLPPAVNQNARLNANFVVRAGADSSGGAGSGSGRSAYWRPATEWENPIWGWLVVNYADSGLQLFLRDGTFYREVRFGGPGEAFAEPAWLPFAPSKLPDEADTAQLAALVVKLQDRTYLAAFWSMVVGALDNLAPTPTAYAQFLSSVVGRPLALANMGWSLELDGPPLKNESTNSAVANPVPHLLAQGPEDENSYSFRIKLGDKMRQYDGLVGYFSSNPRPTGLQDELVLDQINTYYTTPVSTTTATNDDPSSTVLRPILADTYPILKPFWIPPFPDKAPYTAPISPAAYTDMRNSQLEVFGAIVDPFTPVHAYTSLLPSHTLQLPAWTWQAAIQAITAFFHAGPLHVTSDVAPYSDTQQVTTENVADAPASNVALPALPADDWSWLQPYVDPDPSGALPVFNAYGIEKKGDVLSPGFQGGPYTALEGFLQLRRPVTAGKPDGT